MWKYIKNLLTFKKAEKESGPIATAKCICEMQPHVTGYCHKHHTDWL